VKTRESRLPAVTTDVVACTAVRAPIGIRSEDAGPIGSFGSMAPVAWSAVHPSIRSPVARCTTSPFASRSKAPSRV
jgi:hypothetical protein